MFIKDYIVKLLIVFTTSFFLGSCGKSYVKDLKKIISTDSSLTISDWEVEYNSKSNVFSEIVLRKEILDTTIYFHYTKFYKYMDIDTLYYGIIFVRHCFHEKGFFNEKVISNNKILYHFRYPDSLLLDINDPSYLRDTSNLIFIEGKKYYYDHNI